MFFPSQTWTLQPPYGVGLSGNTSCYSAAQFNGPVNSATDANPLIKWTQSGSASTSPKLATVWGFGEKMHPAPGVNGAFRYESSPAWTNDADDFSVVYVCNATAALATDSIHFGRGGSTDSVRVYYTSATNIRFSWIDSTPAQFDLNLTTSTYVQGQVLRICITKKGTTRAVYLIDGVGNRFSATQTSGGATARNSSTIGWYVGTKTTAAGGSGDQGAIHFAVYKTALNAGDAFAELENPWRVFAPRKSFFIPNAITTGAYTLNAETGVYSFTGTDATLLHNYALTLESASYSLTGSNATLLKGLILDAASGSYILTGSNASLVYNKLLNASSGSYSVTGSDANLIYTPASGAYVLNAESGAYVLTGSDVTFTYSGGTVTLKAGSWIRYRIIT